MKDPTALQTLLNSLTAYNGQWNNATERWKIRNEYDRYHKDENGNPYLTKERLAYVKEILAHQYNLLVQRRGMTPRQRTDSTLDKVVNFLTNPATRTSLLLLGTPGTGKTTFMRAAFMTIGFLYREEIGSRKLTSRWTKASELGALLKTDKDAYKAIKDATILCIDDLGFNGESEVVNDYGVKARPIEDIIEHRYDRQLMTICTSNLTEGEIREKYGERIYSRICEAFSIVAVAGMDYRIATR